MYSDPECDGVFVNHALVIVGWGTNLDRVDYWIHWIARNSWGTGWGLPGYVQILRGVNKCRIEAYPAYVVPK